ncbi:MAG: AbrB/MazE/SpoVT family DNA-binding domain-containing protein [Candidatus Methanoperedens sp.]|nr:AbrB/MazE/SpoVT family DNA-binding domain-containing protein [Candidatus Methanoperedens sp.]
MEYGKITKKGQVTIPLKFREILKIQTGEKVLFDLEGEKVVLKKAPLNPVANLVGLGKGIFGDSVKYQRKIRDEWEDK